MDDDERVADGVKLPMVAEVRANKGLPMSVPGWTPTIGATVDARMRVKGVRETIDGQQIVTLECVEVIS